MNNEKYNQIIEEVGQKYTKWWYDNAIPSSNGKPKLDGEDILTRGEFINRIKTDSEFSERWGLLIKETYNLIPHTEDFGDGLTITRPKRRNKLIVVYKNEIIEVYE